ncbi:MAG: PH domain-containing protein [Chthoniobacter sp.]|uniref:PH domain-containing protein n=1 Tax=Chthoniobacter sp. TaxID=2510640 RepID=UPI0032A867AB
MSAPLTDAEEVLWKGSVSHWHYAGKWLLVVVFIAALVANVFLRLISDPTMSWIVCGVLALLALVLIVWIRLDRSRRTYTVTNRRVSVEFGIVSKRSNELRIQDIRSINLTTTGLSGLVGIGRLEFSTAASDDADVIFWNTPGATKVRDLVRSLQAVAIAST